MNPVFGFLRRLFVREEKPDPGSVVEELWIAELSGPERGRFLAENTQSYAAHYENGALALDLKRPHLFAWTEAPVYRYEDFVLEGEFEFAPLPLKAEGATLASGRQPPHAAGGFLFRFADEDNFYAVLVSNRGFFRLDAVFNGKPRALIAWTEIPGRSMDRVADEQAAIAEFSLRVIARDARLAIMVNDAFAGEIEDTALRQGHIALAGQLYGEGVGLRLILHSCFAESRPVEVEAWYYRHLVYAIPDPAARFRLAETFCAMGEWLAALVQLKKIRARRALSPEESFLVAEASIRLGLLEDAAAAIDETLRAAPDLKKAVLEKANILYLQSRYPELRDYAASALATVSGSPEEARVHTLLGHAHFNLGDFSKAAESYGRAAALEPGQPLLKMNEARALDQAGERNAAAEAYIAAARGFYEAEADDDLALALSRLAELKPRAAETRALKAKALFRAGKKAEARKLIEKLLAEGSADSSLYYLSGLLAAEKGERETALMRYERAAELEPSYPLYAFRLAESLFLLGRPEAEAAIARALALAPDDGWVRNLAGMALLREGTEGEDRALPPETARLAREHLEAARRALPEAVEPALNLAELESLEGRLEAACAALAPFPNSGAARNQAGNVYAREARRAILAAESAEAEAATPHEDRREPLLECAAREYERATALEPGNAEYETNLAATYFELERYSDAEERVRKALDAGGEPRTYLIAGNLAMIYGDRIRAEAAYRLGLESAKDNPLLLFALGRSYLRAGKVERAEECRMRLMAVEPERAQRLGREILEATTVHIACAACGRSWRAPRELPRQSAASIRAMPPDDSPAGACPRCGKVYCIACRKAALIENRFTCPDCGDALKLADDRLRWLVREHLKRATP